MTNAFAMSAKSHVETELKIPNHVAIIPDGNRRWAKKRGLPGWLGHRYGAQAFQENTREALKLRVPNLSFWGSSQDNITKREAAEVRHLLAIYKREFMRLAKSREIHDNKVRVNILGEWPRLFPDDVCRVFEKTMAATKAYGRHNLNFFIAYDGQTEMLRAVESVLENVRATGARPSRGGTAVAVTPALIKANLYTRDLPPVDLVIRTGGEPHWSAGFMMWDCANAQLYFTEKLYPDFGAKEFREAIADYSRRERRFGG
ncbi:di-trans,poly-cis-decaprenylcistransferase [Candidatus Parcubacteria bacterium]|nr:di-trans,poly-cis-decaprenylcistransferase [Candidatus Parcubacteria bacterium]